MRRVLILIATSLSFIVLAAVLGLTYMRAYFIVHPVRGPILRTPESVGITDYQAVTFPSADGLKLKGWWVPSQNGSAIIFIHGHGGNRTNHLEDAALLTAKGYGALLFDLRNSGESEGEANTMGLLEVNDVRGAAAFVLLQPEVDADRIGLLGQSMGGSTVIMATARIPQISAVIAESAFTSLEDNIRTGVEKLAGLPPFPFAPLVVSFGQFEAGVDIRQVRSIDDIASISPRPT